MRRLTIPIVLAPALLVGCAAHKKVATHGTLADLRNVPPDVQETEVNQGLDQAMQNYRRFLEDTPESAMTPEAMRRLADLEVEKQFGIRTGKPREMATPESGKAPATTPAPTSNPAGAVAGAGRRESDQEFERRTTAESRIQTSGDAGASPAEVLGTEEAPKGPLEAIAIY